MLLRSHEIALLSRRVTVATSVLFPKASSIKVPSKIFKIAANRNAVFIYQKHLNLIRNKFRSLIFNCVCYK